MQITYTNLAQRISQVVMGQKQVHGFQSYTSTDNMLSE